MQFVYQDNGSLVAATLSTDSNELKIVFDDISFADDEGLSDILVAFSVDDENKGLVTINQGKTERSMKMEEFIKLLLGKKPDIPVSPAASEEAEVIRPGNSDSSSMTAESTIPPDMIPGPSVTLAEWKQFLATKDMDILSWADKYGGDIYKMYPNLQIFTDMYRS